MDIGEKIKKLREDKGYSLYRLAQLTGISQNNIKNNEEGISLPTIETLERLLPYLGISFSELFNDDESVSYLIKHEKELLDTYRKLSPYEQDYVVHTIDFIYENNKRNKES